MGSFSLASWFFEDVTLEFVKLDMHVKITVLALVPDAWVTSHVWAEYKSCKV